MTRSLLPLLLLLLTASTAFAQTLTGVSVSPTAVVGGNADTGTLTLSGAAPAGGVSVTLSSGSASVTVPATILVPVGATTKTFAVTSVPVAAAAAAMLTATLTSGGSPQTATLTVNPPAVAALGLNPSSVVGGASSTGTVTLTGKAPTGGLSVALTSGSTSATVSTPILVPAGATSATFPVTTAAVAASATVTITAMGGGTSKSVGLTLTPSAVLYSLALAPATLAGGNAAVGTVTLNGPAPAGGATVTLTNANAAATVPASVPVAAGASSVTFPVTTVGVSASTAGAVGASYGGVGKSVALTVTPAALSGVSLLPASVTGGTPSAGTVTLTGKASAAGITVALGSSNTSATVPVNVVVAAGSSTGAFSVTTSPVGTTATATVTATYGVAKTAVLTLAPPAVSGVSLSPASVTGGATSTGTVTLTGNAPTGGVTVPLSSSSTSATVPASVLVPAGVGSATFTVSTTSVASSVSATITATYGVAKTALLAVTPLALSSVSLAPASVTGGSPSTGTVTLSGAAPAGGVTVTLLSNNTSATVPASVPVAAGATTGTFQVTTSPVGATATVTITATYGAAQTATLTVVPPAVSGVSLSPTSVTGGSPSVGTVTLTGNAPMGGTTVNLQSDTTTAATVPASVVVTAGASTATFPVTTVSVTSVTTVTITASAGSAMQTATLTVNPSSAILSTVSLDKAAIYALDTGTGTVSLASNAGSATTVSLTSNDPSITVPLNVIVPAGQMSSSFTYTSNNVYNVTTATVSATLNGTTVVTTIDVSPFIDLSVVATGSNKVTLYWKDSSGAIGYNVYRSQTVDGTFVKVNVTPTTLVDNAQGLTNAFMYTDSGLTTGSVYFYYVVAVNTGGIEGGNSNIDSATPDASAVPWDTGDPVQIIAAVNATAANDLDPDDDGSGGTIPQQVGLLTVSAPDGVMYMGNFADGSSAQAFSAPGHIVGSSLVCTDGVVVPAADYSYTTSTQGPSMEATGGVPTPVSIPSNSPYPSTTPDPTGVYREVEAFQGFYGMEATIGLPLASDSNTVTLYNHVSTSLAGSGAIDVGSNYPDTGDIYSGGVVYPPAGVTLGGKNVYDFALDAGLELAPHPGLPLIWTPIIANSIRKQHPNNNQQHPDTGDKVYVDGSANFLPIGRTQGALIYKQYLTGEIRMQFLTPDVASVRDQSVELHFSVPVTGVNSGHLVLNKYSVANKFVSGTPVNYITLVAFNITGWRKKPFTGVSKNILGQFNNYGNNQFVIKRVNSLAQTLNIPGHSNPSYPGAPFANAPTNQTIKGFLADGAYIRSPIGGSQFDGAYWGNAGDPLGVRLKPSTGGWETWTDDSTITGRAGQYPLGFPADVSYIIQNPYFWEINVSLSAL